MQRSGKGKIEMNKWIKGELKKNPVEIILVGSVNFVRENKTQVLTASAVCLLILFFALAYFRARSVERTEAAKVFASAEMDFANFNYTDAASKAARIPEDYPRSGILDQAFYMMASAHYERGEIEKSIDLLKEAAGKFKRSSIRAEIYHTLGELLEENGDYDLALEAYSNLPDNHYLKPSADYSRARILELQDDLDSALKEYTRISAHHPESFWGEFASTRIRALRPENPEEPFESEIILD